MPLTALLETTFSEAPQVDREAGIIRGVKILGRDSRNGRTYSDVALWQAARLYAGLCVNLNHPVPSAAGAERPVEEGFGWLEGVRVEADGVFGDLYYLKSHPHAAVLCEAAERNPRRFGLSHNASGTVVTVGGKHVVESISSVRSVDIVQNPATNSGLFESESENHSMPATIQQILSSHSGGRLEKLLEMNGLADAGALFVDVPSDAPAEDQLTAAFKALITAVLDDSSLDRPAKLAKIKQILQAQEKLTGSGAETQTAGDSLATPESHAPEPDNRLEKLLERLERIEANAACRGLLAIHDRTCDPTRIKALLALATESERVQLIETWPARSALGRGQRPDFSAPLRESAGETKFPSDTKSFVAALR